MAIAAPVGILNLSKKTLAGTTEITPERIYGGYTNGRGEISLFSEALAYRVNFKSNTVQQRACLNPGAQARYDAASAGETFEYCSKKFRRLSNAEILEICSSGPFRVAFRVT